MVHMNWRVAGFKKVRSFAMCICDICILSTRQWYHRRLPDTACIQRATTYTTLPY